jgi:hypothetical protein
MSSVRSPSKAASTRRSSRAGSSKSRATGARSDAGSNAISASAGISSAAVEKTTSVPETTAQMKHRFATVAAGLASLDQDITNEQAVCV